MSAPTYASNFGSESYIIVAPQSAWGTKAAPGDLIQTIFEPTSMAFRQITEPAQTSRLKGNNSPTKNTVAMLRAEGTVDMYVHSTDMGFWLRQLLHANVDEITSTQNTAQVVQATSTAYTGFSSFSALSSEPNEVLTAPIEAGKLEFTWASLTQGSDGGKVEITGRDQNDLRIEEDIDLTELAAGFETVLAARSYSSTAITTASNPRDVLPSTQANGGTLRVTFSGATGNGNVTIVGTDADGTETATLNFTNAATTSTLTTTANFITITSITIGAGITGGTVTVEVSRAPRTVITTDNYFKNEVMVKISGVTAGTFGVKADPGTWTHTIPLSDRVGEGFTAEIGKGGDTPSTYDSCLISQATLTLADVLTMSFTALARQGDLRYGIGGVRGQEHDRSGFSRPGIDLVPNWGWALDIDGQVYPCSDGTLLINQNIEYPQTLFWGSIYYPKPVRQNEREITVEATIDYTIDNDFDVHALGDEFVTKISAVLKKVGGPYVAIEFTLPQSELVGYPDPEVPNLGQINQSLSIRGYTGSAAGNDEVSVKIINEESAIV